MVGVSRPPAGGVAFGDAGLGFGVAPPLGVVPTDVWLVAGFPAGGWAGRELGPLPLPLPFDPPGVPAGFDGVDGFDPAEGGGVDEWLPLDPLDPLVVLFPLPLGTSPSQ